MKKSPYSPDEFMSGLYGKIKPEPYKNAVSYEDAFKIGQGIKEKAKELFSLVRLNSMATELKLVPVGKALDYPEYTLKKYSVEILEGLNSLVYILEPKNVNGKTGGVVALCGHGYGVRQILNISKKGNKKHFNYIDNYQNNFAVEMAKRGCTVIAPELFGFGEARLSHDLLHKLLR